jgi:hypothetical protein
MVVCIISSYVCTYKEVTWLVRPPGLEFNSYWDPPPHATVIWPCTSKPSQSKRRRRVPWAKAGCWKPEATNL